MKQTTITGPQGELAVYAGGNDAGPPILFIHADPGRASQWDDVIKKLAADYSVVAFDQPGHGSSPSASDGDYSFRSRAGDVEAVADALLDKPFVVVGHSGGAAVALEYAAAHPARVIGLFLLDPATDPRQIPQEQRDQITAGMNGADAEGFMKGYVMTIAGPNPDVQKRVLADVSAMKPDAMKGVGLAMLDWNPEPSLKAIKIPMFVLATPYNNEPSSMHRMREGIPHEIVEGTGHWIQLDKPDFVADAIRRFITSIKQP